MQTEPVRIIAAIQAALIAIWGVVIIVATIPDNVAGAVTIAIGAVITAVSSIVLRGRVEPTPPTT